MSKDGKIQCVLDEKALHTVMLDREKCIGCVNCMRRCPTEAIRVRNGKASVNYDRCIGCGECVRLCGQHAKLPSHDDFDTINDFKYKIALPAPSLYGQFNNLTDIDTVLNGLLAIGFDDVYEVGRAADYCTGVTKMLMNVGTYPKPVISTACPAVVELIMMRFQNLKEHLLGILAPVDVAAKLAREKAIKNGVPEEDIGVYFISPCPAKVFGLKMGIGVKHPYVDRVLSVSDVYMRLVPAMSALKEIKPMTKMSSVGLNWGVSRGEANAIFRDKTIAADGIENVIKILEALEDGGLSDIDFIELNACTSGCVGGVMNVENPFVARSRIQQLTRKLPATLNSLADTGKSVDYFCWELNPVTKDVFKLDDDRVSAMAKLLQIDSILETLPHADCGLCGAPSCRAFAEDLVNEVIPSDTVCPRLEQK
ncbi:MAG: [Fe-Fe] hydrogenase large subunit C-terminal domain-containing protein [Clostridia bacterium]